ncbi:MAG: ABC transporter permease [Bacteroidaceae bacterium]|nr:ABC transporter permease [Bacteroidaceae bacterium]
MKWPFFIARRYLMAKKSHNVINVISTISMAGIALASFALICTLSVFNGFHSLVQNLLSEFDPQLAVVPAHGRFLDTGDARLDSIMKSGQVETACFSLEEQALIQYGTQQQVCMIKGVDDRFHELTGIEHLLRGNGIFMLKDEVTDYCIMGVGLMGKLDCGINPARGMSLYIPRLDGKSVNPLNPGQSFNHANVFSPGVIFKVNQEKYDENYVLVSLDLAQQLTGRKGQASALELKLKDGVSERMARRRIGQIAGPDFKVLDRVQQQPDVFKVVKLEKFVSYLFLSFILLIACFNIIGSLILLIIDKRTDASLLESMGATRHDVERIFTLNGVMSSFIGALTGLVLGVIAILLQQHFGILKLGDAGNFIVDAYPVVLKMSDLVIVLLTVLAVSYIAILPVGPLSRKLTARE